MDAARRCCMLWHCVALTPRCLLRCLCTMRRALTLLLLVNTAEHIDAGVHIVTADIVLNGELCRPSPSCWMKFLVLAMTSYTSVMFMDGGVLAVRSLDGAFEIFEQQRTPTAYEIARVPDVDAALRFPQSDCLHTGLFIVAPNLPVRRESSKILGRTQRHR